MRHIKPQLWNVLIFAIFVGLSSAGITLAEQNQEQTCEAQDPRKCVFDKKEIVLMGNSQYEEELSKMYAEKTLLTREEAESRRRKFQEDRINRLDLSDSAKEQLINEPTERRRKLFSSSNQFAGVNEGNILAYEGDFVYVVSN